MASKSKTPVKAPSATTSAPSMANLPAQVGSNSEQQELLEAGKAPEQRGVTAESLQRVIDLATIDMMSSNVGGYGGSGGIGIQMVTLLLERQVGQLRISEALHAVDPARSAEIYRDTLGQVLVELTQLIAAGAVTATPDALMLQGRAQQDLFAQAEATSFLALAGLGAA